ncbi:MAG TPA: hypothetical protein VGB76_06565 [Pyrinomonadaceae bacterium]|jgi:hypothetical protein
MRALSDSELLDVWEHALEQPPLERALTLLAAATGIDAGELAHLSIGERDALLLDLREQTFGAQLSSVATCPSCNEPLEMSFRVAQLRVATPADKPPGSFSLNVGGYEVSFRLPNSLDLSALASVQEVAAARRVLFERCLLAARRGDEEQTAGALPPEVVDAIVERMGQVDAQGDMQFALKCPACAHQWLEAFDIDSFFWMELNVWAQRTLREVHALARAYGWRETDILSLSPQRRRFYLSMFSE